LESGQIQIPEGNAMKPKPYFSKALFQFLVELKFNNDRAWFNANKTRYENDLKKPLLAFAEDFQGPLKKVNPSFISDKRSVFRIYRDTRFAKDKTPYKTHAAAQFRHRAASADVHAPGFYLHLEPGESFAAAGIWGPEPEPLKRIRQAIAKGGDWAKLSKFPLWGESLKRPPKGFDPGHKHIADLKRKHFITWVDFKDSQVLAADFMKQVAAAFKKTDPLIRFLCGAMGLKG
jgi:uncharacterized protein (TIGR02453 family)